MGIGNDCRLSDIAVIDRGSAIYADRYIFYRNTGVVGNGDVKQDGPAPVRERRCNGPMVR